MAKTLSRPPSRLLTRLARHARRFRGEGANVVIIFGLSLPIVIGGAALGVETSYWYLKDVQLQAAADAAAYTAAIEKRSGSTSTVIRNAATVTASGNGYDSAIGTMTINSPPTSGPNQVAAAIEVILQQPVNRYFTRIFSTSTVNETARAVARFQSIGDACILALNPTATKAVTFSGNTGVNVKGCDVMANSTANNAIYTSGSSTTHAGCFITTGQVDMSGGTTTLDCANPLTHQDPIADPFLDLPVPTASGSCLSDNPATLNPGKYCAGMNLKGTQTLNPGVYVVSGGDFKVNANANITGNGVMIYLTGAARVSMNGNATTTLSAPTSGTYSGVLFFGDRTNNGTTNNTFNGTDASSLTGYLYFASQPMNYLGNFSGTKGCTRVVASVIQWSGNTTVDDTQDCSTLGLRKTPTSQIIYLVE
jgi:hypothetical protein